MQIINVMMNKVTANYKKLSMHDFIRKCIYVLTFVFNLSFIRKLKSIFYLKNSNTRIGKNVRFFGFPINVSIKKNVNVYDNCIFEFGVDSELIIGENVIMSYGVLISCKNSIIIGNDVQIGEYTSIRDSTHNYSDSTLSFMNAPDILSTIKIGNNVWIGRGCIILPGTIIEDKVVIGANSVIKGHCKSNWIYAGSPLKQIKYID